jgi:TetR/AcrR family acrAB operon transcriptional repressor
LYAYIQKKRRAGPYFVCSRESSRIEKSEVDLMRRTKEEAEQTRRALLDAGLRVFGRQGYAATKLEDIAREADVTRRAIYWHFGGKAELYQALIQERIGPANALLGQILAADQPPLAKLRLLLVRALEYLEEDADYRAVLELTLFKSEATPDLAAGVAAQATRALCASLAEIVRAGIAGGDIRPDVEPQAAALAAIGLLNGVAATWLLDPAAFSPRAQATPIADAFLHGLARPTISASPQV